MALILIRKNKMLAINMLADNIYELIIMAIMRSILTFKIEDMESENKKYEMVYCFSHKLLLLDNLVLYIYKNSEKDDKVVNAEIPEMEAKGSLILSLPQLCLGIYTTKNLCITLIESPKSRFAANPSLSDIKYICRHACAIIFIKKEIGFSLGPHCLDTLSFLVFTLEIINEIACRYFHLFLEQADIFHMARMK